jgi:hypothetical protein
MNEREAVGTLLTTSLPQKLSESIIDLFFSSHGHEKPSLLGRYIGLQDVDHHVELFDKLIDKGLINQMGGIS